MGKNTLVTLLLSVFIAFLGIGIIIPIMPVFASFLGASGFALGMIIAAFSITRGLLLPVVGSLSDRWGRKGFLASGLLIYGIVGLLIPLALNVTQLIGIRSFHGIGSAMIVPVAMAYMSALSPAGQEGRYMSYLNAAIFCGIGCGPIIGGLVFDGMGVAAVFYLMALLSFIALVLVLFFMPAHLSTETSRNQKGLAESFRSMLANLNTRGILLARFSTMIIMVPTMAFLPLIMSAWPGNSGLQIGIVIAVRTLVNALLQVPFGKLSDRFPKLPILVVGSIVLPITVMCIPWVSNFYAMAFLYLILGTVEAAIWAVLGAYASIEAKERYGHGSMMGAFSFAMSIGVFSGAVLSGYSMDRWGIVFAYTAAGITVLLVSMIATHMIHTHNKNSQ